MTSPGDATAPAVIRRLLPSVLLPALVYEIGHGAIVPVIALVAIDEGASTTVAGLILSMMGIGRILGAAPAAWASSRLGDRTAMLAAAVVTAVAMLLCLLVGSIWVLAICLLVMGGCAATFYLARQTYITDTVETGLRARVLSTLGGVHRIGLFFGPFLGAAAIALWGTRAAFGVGAAVSVVTGLLLWLVRDDQGDGSAGHRPSRAEPAGFAATFRANRALFCSLGIAVLAVGAIRAAREAVLPLWADHIGLTAAVTSLIFGIANAVDMSLFYPAGYVMDRLGRLWITVPSMLLLGLGTLALPLTGSAVTLTIAAMVMSLGNGIGSGMMMTLGSDVAPERGRTAFLAIWRVISDTGTAAGPLVPAGIALFAPLAAGIATIGAVGLGAAAALARWVPRYSPHATPSQARARRTLG